MLRNTCVFISTSFIHFWVSALTLGDDVTCWGLRNPFGKPGIPVKVHIYSIIAAAPGTDASQKSFQYWLVILWQSWASLKVFSSARTSTLCQKQQGIFRCDYYNSNTKHSYLKRSNLFLQQSCHIVATIDPKLYFLLLAAYRVKSVPSNFSFYCVLACVHVGVCVCFWFWLFACFCLSRNPAWFHWG